MEQKMEEQRVMKEYHWIDMGGKIKYVVNYYSGKKHNDGSKIFDIAIFKNKEKMRKFVNEQKMKRLLEK